MPNIQVDFEVFKALTALRPQESVTENDVLRSLLKLPAVGTVVSIPPGLQGERIIGPRIPVPMPPPPADWVTKGVNFPEGTEFRANYKGQTHLGRVHQRALVVNGERFDSPSAAAMRITGGTPVNGWLFWECRLPGEGQWRIIKSLRPKG
ncbi:MAG: DUF2924 domain-containing protein [Betaproteobacteria bacterium]|nr:DUF2924 domain-containing protein [Betaproteobacteria bacterium]